MAFGRLERTDAPKPMGEINMTPLIDVMLVLLVIFIITAPLMASSLKLDLPKTVAGGPSNAREVLLLAVTADAHRRYGPRSMPNYVISKADSVYGNTERDGLRNDTVGGKGRRDTRKQKPSRPGALQT